MLFGIIKTGVGFVAGACASVVVENAIKATTPTVVNEVSKAMIKVGSFFIGGLVAMKVMEYNDQLFDEVKDAVDAVKELSELETEQV